MLNHTYEYMLAIARNRNITKAAAELFITQPALTKYLNRLEGELGVRLFERSRNTVTPTPAGRIFLEKAEEIMKLEGQLLESLHSASPNLRGQLSIGITPELSSVLLPRLLPGYISAYPKVEIQIEEGSNENLIAAVKQEKIEMALIAVSPKESGYCFEAVLEDPIILVMPATHPIAQQFDLSSNSPYTPYYLEAEQLAKADFIVCSSALGIGAISKDLFRRHHISPNILLKLHQNETAVHMVSSGIGMAFTPARTPLRIELQGPLAYFSLDTPVYTRNRGIFFKEETVFSEPVRIFIEMFKRSAQTLPELSSPVCQVLNVAPLIKS